MFRSALHPLVHLGMVLSLTIAAEPALAVFDLENVVFTRRVARTSEGHDDIRAEIRVQGIDILNATITLPSAPNTQVPLGPDGADWLVSDNFLTEAELDAVLPNGNYVLRMNNGAVTVTIPYTRPAVPSPSISSPTAGKVLSPGLLEVNFTACGGPCSQLNDSVEALLEDESMNELASEMLTENDASWIPQDGMGGDLALGENLDLLVTITHTAVRQNGDIPIDDDDDAFVFTHVFVQSDEVGFRTGFEPPTGAFCIVVNDPAPPAGCSTVSDPLLSIVDTSGMVVTSVDGHDLDYSFTVGEKGTLTGNAMADLDDDASQETAGAIKGKLKGKGGELKQKLAFRLLNDALAARLRVSVNDVLSIPLDSLARTQKASGRIGELRIKEELPSNESPLPFAPQGWRVDFTVDAGVLQGGALELEQGRSFVLEGTSRFNLASNLSNLRLQTPERGIRIQLKKVLLDDESSPTAVGGGSLAYKILGQSGKATLP